MKLIPIHILLISFVVCFFVGCTKKTTEDVFVPYPTPSIDTVWVNDTVTPPITSTFIKQPIVDSFNCVDDDGNNFGDTLMVDFPQLGCLMINHQNASVITRPTKIKSEIIAIKSKGDLIRTGIQTIANNGQLLDMGVFINIKLSSKGNEIFWNNTMPRGIQVKVKDLAPKIKTQYYSYVVGIDSNYSWSNGQNTLNGGSASAAVIVSQGGQTKPIYLINTKNIGWFGCASTDTATANSQKTRISVVLPANFTNKNTIVYAAFQNAKTVVRLLPNATLKSYSISNIPQKANITLIALAKINGETYLASLSTTVTGSIPYRLTPVKKTAQEINQFLNGL